ncbi:MAG: hypothetical protein QME05_05105 [Candidatus Margulisbacteria bacterium]|nr:hypothetical protein [Candidatus Margulisiibacteriota bacterium]
MPITLDGQRAAKIYVRTASKTDSAETKQSVDKIFDSMAASDGNPKLSAQEAHAVEKALTLVDQSSRERLGIYDAPEAEAISAGIDAMLAEGFSPNEAVRLINSLAVDPNNLSRVLLGLGGLDFSDNKSFLLLPLSCLVEHLDKREIFSFLCAIAKLNAEDGGGTAVYAAVRELLSAQIDPDKIINLCQRIFESTRDVPADKKYKLFNSFVRFSHLPAGTSIDDYTDCLIEVAILIKSNTNIPYIFVEYAMEKGCSKSEILRALKQIASLGLPQNDEEAVFRGLVDFYFNSKSGVSLANIVNNIIKIYQTAGLNDHILLALSCFPAGTGMSLDDYTDCLIQAPGITGSDPWYAYEFVAHLNEAGFTKNQIIQDLKETSQVINILYSAEKDEIWQFMSSIKFKNNPGLTVDDCLSVYSQFYWVARYNQRFGFWASSKLLNAGISVKEIEDIWGAIRSLSPVQGTLTATISDASGRVTSTETSTYPVIAVSIDLLSELANRIEQGETLASIKSEYELLKMLSISWPNRFSREVRSELVQNRQNNQADGRPLAILIYPKHDFPQDPQKPGEYTSGGVYAFTRENDIFQDLIQRGYRVMYYEAGNEAEFYASLRDGSRAQRASLLIVAGHGTIDSVQLGNDYFNEEQVLDLSDTVELRRNKVPDTLAAGGAVLLFSCSTGEGKESGQNIANLLRKIFPQAASIAAPTVPTHPEELIFNEQGRVTGVKYSVGPDQVYESLPIPR